MKANIVVCHDNCCLFHINEDSCVIPKDRNFYHCVHGVVDSCINRIYNEKDLSVEGKVNLKEWMGERE